MSVPTVGSDIGSLCGKCKRETHHVILAMVGSTIARVQCKVCDSQHRFKSPVAEATPRRKAAAGGKAAGGAKATTRPKPEEGPTVQSDLSRPVRAYRADQTFQVADRVEHPHFGVGVVELVESGKITVYFPAGRRILAQARSEAQLLSRRPLPTEAQQNAALGPDEEEVEAGSGAPPF